MFAASSIIMASQNQDLDLPLISNDVVIESNFQRWFLRMINGMSIGNKIKCGYALALSVGICHIKGGITVERYYGDIPSIQAFSGFISQVFMNILNNALDALEEQHHEQHRPRIEISTERQEND